MSFIVQLPKYIHKLMLSKHIFVSFLEHPNLHKMKKKKLKEKIGDDYLFIEIIRLLHKVLKNNFFNLFRKLFYNYF